MCRFCTLNLFTERWATVPDADRRPRRYLRARDFDVQAAFRQYSATVQWRRKLGLDEMYRSVEVTHFEAIRRLVYTKIFSSFRKAKLT